MHRRRSFLEFVFLLYSTFACGVTIQCLLEGLKWVDWYFLAKNAMMYNIWDTIFSWLSLSLLHTLQQSLPNHNLQILTENNIWSSLLSATPSINHANYLSPCNIYDNATNDIVLIESISHMFWYLDTYQIWAKPSPFSWKSINDLLSFVCGEYYSYLVVTMPSVYPPSPFLFSCQICAVYDIWRILIRKWTVRSPITLYCLIFPKIALHHTEFCTKKHSTYRHHSLAIARHYSADKHCSYNSRTESKHRQTSHNIIKVNPNNKSLYLHLNIQLHIYSKS